MQKSWIISSLFFFIASAVFSQDRTEDRNLLLSDVSTINSKYEGRHVRTMSSKHRSVIAKYNPVQLVFTGLMFTYQKLISPQLSASCIYSPSCSNFSKSAIAEFGLIKGVFLSADRMMRCNRAAAMEVSPLIVDEHLHLAKDDVDKYKTSNR